MDIHLVSSYHYGPKHCSKQAGIVPIMKCLDSLWKLGNSIGEVTNSGWLQLNINQLYSTMRGNDYLFYSSSRIYTIQEGIFRNVNPLLIHVGLFWSTISSQASAAQRAEWMSPDSKMIGTYSQVLTSILSPIYSLDLKGFDPTTPAQ